LWRISPTPLTTYRNESENKKLLQEEEEEEEGYGYKVEYTPIIATTPV
jgi:hypothetical protein